MKRVAVLGAGACGLTAIKCCKEEGIDVVCFEKTERIGGLWNYHESDEQEVPSCMKATIINTSKEMSAFSDFPPPKEFPNFMHNKMMLKYLQLYAKNFSLLPHVKLLHDVHKVFPAEDYFTSGRWIVCYKNDQGSKQEIFDGVMICTGHHSIPNIPVFPDLEMFKGRVMHTHSLKTVDSFKDSRVLIIGAGNSALDSAVDISTIAKQVYMSTRRGFWLLFRVGNKGIPSDIATITRVRALLLKLAGYQISSSFVEYDLNKRFDHGIYGVKPKHHFLSQHPSINDHLPEKILNGTVKIKRDISRFAEEGVIFKGDNEITAIDKVVLATGYKIVFPFLSTDILSSKDNEVFLYKHAFPPTLAHPSLAVIGLMQPFGPILPIAESQSRWYAQLMNGKHKLPPRSTMIEHIRKSKAEMAERYFHSPRHTIEVDFVPFMDEIAIEYGAKPNLLKMALTDPQLFWKCFFGPCLAYQYRLQGPHPWNGARDAIMNYEERFLYPLKESVASRSEDFILMKFLSLVFYFFAVAYISGFW